MKKVKSKLMYVQGVAGKYRIRWQVCTLIDGG